VPAGLVSQARLAVANCPEHAISLTEAPELNPKITTEVQP
jgi:hypothetical protein